MIKIFSLSVLIILTLMVIYRCSGYSNCSNDKFYDKLNTERSYGSSMRADKQFDDNKKLLDIKKGISKWNLNSKYKISTCDIDKDINVDDYSLVVQDTPIQIFFNNKNNKVITFYNHRYIDADKYFELLKTIMKMNTISLPTLTYIPYISELSLIPYGLKMSKKLLLNGSSLSIDLDKPKHSHYIVDDEYIKKFRQYLPNTKTKSIIAFIVLSYILKSIKKGTFKVLFTVGFNRNSYMYNKVGNMIGGILLEIPVALRGIKLLKFIDNQLKKEMSQAVHSLNFQLSLPAMSKVPELTRNKIDMIFSISPHFNCGIMPDKLEVLVPFIIQPIYSLVLSCNDKHFIYIASMSSKV